MHGKNNMVDPHINLVVLSRFNIKSAWHNEIYVWTIVFFRSNIKQGGDMKQDRFLKQLLQFIGN